MSSSLMIFIAIIILIGFIVIFKGKLLNIVSNTKTETKKAQTDVQNKDETKSVPIDNIKSDLQIRMENAI